MGETALSISRAIHKSQNYQVCSTAHGWCVSLDPPRSRHKNGIRCARDLFGEISDKDNGGGIRSRQGEPADHEIDLRAVQRTGRKGWV